MGGGCAAPQSRRDDRCQARLREAARLARPPRGSIEVGSELHPGLGTPEEGRQPVNRPELFQEQ